MDFLFGSGDNKTTKTETYAPNPYATSALQRAEAMGSNLPGTMAVPLQGTEGFSPDQLAAFQGVRNAQGAYNPYAARAAALNAEYGKGLDTGRVQDMYSQLSQGPLEQLWAQQRAQMGQTTRNAVQAAGGTGASRIGVTQANLANQQNLATGQLQSGLLSQAINAELAAQANRGAAAAQEANLGMGYTGQLYNDAGQLYGVGSAQQGLGQAELNALYAQQQGQYQNPYMNFQMYSSLLPQYSNIYKGTTTTETEVPEQGLFQTLAGGFGSALANYGMGWLPQPKKAATGGRINGYAPGGTVGKGSGAYTNNPFNAYHGNRGSLFGQMVQQYFPQASQQSPFAMALQNFGQRTSQQLPQAQAPAQAPPPALAPQQPQPISGSPENVGIAPSVDHPKDPFTDPQPIDNAASTYAPSAPQAQASALAPPAPATPAFAAPPAAMPDDMASAGIFGGWSNFGRSMSRGGSVNGYDSGGGVDMLRELFASPEGQRRLADVSELGRKRFAEDNPYQLPANVPGAGKPFNYSDEPMISRTVTEGDPDSKFDAIIDRSRKGDSFRVSPNPMRDTTKEYLTQNDTPFRAEDEPITATGYAARDDEGDGGGVRSSIPGPLDIQYKKPEYNPWASTISAFARGAMAMNKRLPSGHLANFGGGGLGAAIGEGLLAGQETDKGRREEKRKDFDEQLKAARLAEEALKTRLPYERMTVSQEEERRLQAERNRIVGDIAKREDWRYLGPSATNPGKSVFFNQRDGTTEERDVGVAAKPINRVLSSPEQNRLDVASRAVNTQHSLLDGFEDKYAGAGVAGIGSETVGDVKNWIGKNISGASEDLKKQATWWQGYQDFKSDVRHGRFGAALTKYEIGEWAKQDVHPGMQPDMVRKRLEAQFKIIHGALQRKATSLMKQGFSPEAIEAQLGFSPQQTIEGFPYFQRKSGDGGAGESQPSQAAPAKPSVATGTGRFVTQGGNRFEIMSDGTKKFVGKAN